MKKKILACLLVCLLAAAGLAALASAQSEPAPPAAALKGAASSLFIIYRDAAGESVCRVATASERQSLGTPGPASRVLYDGGGAAVDAKGGAAGVYAVTTQTGQTLLPSAGLRIVLHATPQLLADPTARDAFIVAANRWEAVISTPITVVLDVDYGSTFFGSQWPSDDILGVTSAVEEPHRYSKVRRQLLANAPEAAEAALYNALPSGDSIPVELNGATTSTSAVRTTLPVARALGLEPNIGDPNNPSRGRADALIGFNSTHPFDFNPNDGVAPGSLDFDAVVVHEIGHALGFTSESGAGLNGPLTLLDLFRVRPGAVSAANPATLAAARRVMSLGGTQSFFSNRLNSFGANETQLSTGGPSASGGDNRQSSHWKDDNFVPFIGVMDPRLPPGVRETLTDNDRLAFDAFGYKLGGTPFAPPAPPPPAPPANDHFAAAAVIQGASGTAAGENFEATRQANEPDPSHDPQRVFGRRSVWYRWTAPANDTFVFDTVGSDFDTTLGVYTGANFDALQPAVGQAENDDIDTPNGIRTSRVTIAAAAGTTYHIMVNGWHSEIGLIKLNWGLPAPPPPPTPAPTPSTIQFATSDFRADERDGAAPVLITRTGSLTQHHTVSYSVTPGSAVAGADFTPLSGFLTFGSGVRHVVLAVQLKDDAVAETPETVELRLVDSPSGGVLGAPRIATLTINDDDTFPANAVGFAAAGGQVSEGAGKIDLAVTRTGNLSQPASVSYRTADGAIPTGATSVKDYSFAAGTLNFAAGEASKTVTVLLTQDSFNEAVERLRVELSAPVGATLAPGLSSFELAVVDDDPDGLTTNPNDQTADFVTQHYRDFLNRVPDAGGLQFWSEGIDGCATAECRRVKRVDTSAAFFLSIEFQETGYLVYRMHQAAFGLPGSGDPPVSFEDFMRDTQELGRGFVVGAPGWPEKLEANKQAFARAFVSRVRFRTELPVQLPPAEFVDALDARAGRVLTAQQREALAISLSMNNTAEGRAFVLRQVAENATLRTREFRRAFVLMQYFGYMRRDPDSGPDTNLDGYFFWLGKLNEFGGDWRRAEMVRAFIESGEYRRRFGP